jgi:hypothetical protein
MDTSGLDPEGNNTEPVNCSPSRVIVTSSPLTRTSTLSCDGLTARVIAAGTGMLTLLLAATAGSDSLSQAVNRSAAVLTQKNHRWVRLVKIG